ncbi:MAG: hypothetical protein CL389_13245 [Acidiferrobacteraceae bacterium]|jgi:hypothetical protein|nr:hypothetical protein [Acidiferrobacteraceae bacterium]|tara:strand:+ start:935 stop:1654 length:720 start_codon:yes stop_codon:yes gene_type:complete
MMQSEPMILWVGTLVWVAFCLTGTALLLRRRRQGRFFMEHAYLTGVLLLLALAPCIGLLVFAISGVVSFWSGGMQVIFATLLGLAAFRARQHRLNPQTSYSARTFKEKSAALVLVTLLVVFATYFIRTWGSDLDTAIPAFIGAVALLIVVMVIGHITLALFHAPAEELNEEPDERDKAVELLSMRNAYYVLSMGIWVVPIVAVSSLPTLTQVNIWLAVVVISEAVKYGSVFSYYRFGDI